MVTMRPAKGSGKIRLDAWNFVDHNNKTVAKHVNDCVRKVFKEDPPWIDLPWQWTDSDGRSGKPVKDPLTLFVNLPLGKAEDHEVYWQISLHDLICEVLWLHSSHPDEDKFLIEDNKGRKLCRKLAAALRAEADFIERACNGQEQSTS